MTNCFQWKQNNLNTQHLEDKSLSRDNMIHLSQGTGNSRHCFHLAGKLNWKVDINCARIDKTKIRKNIDVGWELKYFWSSTRKEVNRKIKSQNGNGRNSLNLLHWNMGSKFWRNKMDEIRQVIVDKSSDIFTITDTITITDMRKYYPKPQN